VSVQQARHEVDGVDQLVQLGHMQAAAVRDAQDAAHLHNQEGGIEGRGKQVSP
jgi:hypothetical protein